MVRGLSALAAFAAVTACSSPSAPSSDLIVATAESHALDLKNMSDETVYYFVAERGALALLDFAICNEPSKCDSVAPGSRRRVPYSGVVGYSAGSEQAVVFHWRLVSKGGGKYEHDAIRTLIVQLR